MRPGLRRRLHLGIARANAGSKTPGFSLQPHSLRDAPKPSPGGAGPLTGRLGNRAEASRARWRPLAEVSGSTSAPGAVRGPGGGPR